MGSSAGLSASSSVTINSAGTLDVSGNNITIDGLLGTGTINNNGGSAATLTAGASGTSTTFGGVIADGTKAIAVTKTGAGTLTLTGINTYSGATTIQNGTVSVANPGLGGNLGTATSAVILGDASHQGILSYTANADLTYTRGFEVNAGGGQMNITSSGKTLTLSSGGVATTTGAFTLGGAGNVVVNSVISGSGGFTKANTGTLLVNSANTYAGDTTIASGTLQLGNVAALPSGTGKGNLALSGTLDLNDFDLALNGLSGGGLVTNNLGASVLAVGANDAGSTFSGSIRDGLGTSGLTKTGTGTLTLSGNNTFSGATTLVGGTLAMGSDTALSSHSSLTIANAGTLDLNGRVIAIDGLAGTGSITNNSDTKVTLTTGASGGSGIFGGTINDGTKGIIALSKTGAGTATLSNINSYSGGTTVTDGLLAITSTGALGAIPASPTPGNIVLNGGGISAINTFEINANRGIAVGPASGSGSGILDAAQNQTLTYNGIIDNQGSGSGGLTKTGLGTLTLGGANTYSGDTTVSAGSLQIGSAQAIPSGTSKGNLALADGATLDLNNTTYIGGTYIKEGTLVSTSGQAPGPQPAPGSNDYAHHIYDGATLQIAVGSWATERQIELMGDPNGSGGSSGMAIIDITNGFTQQRNGLIYGDGKLDLVGTGTMIVTNANTYSGGTIVENGVLQVNNSSGSATGTGAVTVQNGGTLSGLPTTHGNYAEITGTITGTVTIESTGKLLARSDNPTIAGDQTLTLGGLSLKAGSLSTFQLGAFTTTPLVSITDNNLFTLPTTGLSTIDIINTGAMSAGSTYHLFDYTGTAFSTDYFGKLALVESHSGLFNLRLVNNTDNTSIDLGVEAITQQWEKNGTNTNWSENPWWTKLPYTVPNVEGATALFINNNYLQTWDPVFATTETATLDTDVKLGSLIFNNATTAFTLNTSTGKTLTLDEVGNGNAVIQVINTSGANHEINVPVILNDNLHVVLASGLNISGAISGENKSLTKTGTGALTLSGTAANTYSGLTEVVGGTLNLNKSAGITAIGTGGLQIDSGGTVALLASNQIADGASVTVNGTFALGAYSETIATLTGGGGVTTGSGSVLTLQSAANSSFQGVISGGGGIAKAGTGTLTLDGVNTYTGGTAINGGVVRIGADHNLGGTGGLAFDNGTLEFSNGFISTRNILLNLGGGTLDTDNSDVVLTGLISGAGALTKTGLGTITLNFANAYTGATVIKNGILRISNTSALGTADGGTTVNPGGELELSGDELVVNEPLTLAGGEVCSSVGINTYNGAITLTADSGIDADSQQLIITSVIAQSAGSFGLSKFGPGTVELTGANTYTGATHVEEGTLALSNGAAIADTGTITLANSPDVRLQLNNSETIGALAGGGTTGGNVELGANILTVGDASNTSFSGIISGSGGALTKQGTGTLTLSGANTYTGLTTVAAGALNIQNATALGTSAGATTVASGAAMQIQGNIAVGTEALSLNGSGIGATGALRNISGANTYGGLLTLGSATRINSDAGSLTLSNPGTITGSYALTVGGAGDTSITSNIGTGSLTKDGGGTLTLSGANTYAGNTTVTAGTLRMDNAQAIPSGTGKGNLSLAAPATLDLYNTGITVNGLSGTGLATNSQTGTAAITVGANDQTSTFDGVIEDGNGTTALVKTGTGILTLTGSNHYSGSTTLTAGTLQVGADTHLGHAADTPIAGSLVIQAGATLATTATFTLDNNRGIGVGPSGAGIIDVIGATVLTYGGAIADNGGSGGISKTGGGTLVLSGTSSYTGTTTVAAGVLTVSGSIASSGSVVVQSGATLTGTGSTGALTVAASGTLAPGNSGLGTLSAAGNLILAGNANFDLGTGGTDHATPGLSDRVAVTGNVTLGGNLVLSDNAGANNQGSAGAGSYQLFTYTGEAGGSFSSVSGLPAYHTAVHDAAAEQAIYLDIYNYAGATVTPAVDLGRIHAGGTFGTQTLTVGNTTISGNYTESLGGVIATVATGITATGSVTGIAGQATNSNGMVVGISDNSAGQKSGLVGIDFTSQAVSTSGLADTSLVRQNVTVSGFAYTGQSVWDVSGSGSWGNNVDAYNNWTHAGGVAGLDGTLSTSDTATFGSTTSAPSTVRLDGANPSLSGVTFDNANSYTLDQGSGGQLTLKGNGGAASVTDAAGSHGISAPLCLASDANIGVTHSADTLTISGSVSGSGYGLTKSGGGVLTLAGDSTYTGATMVSQGTLWVNGTLANTTTSVSSSAILGGTGTLGGATTIESGGTHAPGNAGTPGTQTFATGITYNSGSIFEWSLNASDSKDFTDDLGAYGKVVTPSAVAGSANSEAIFKVVLGTNHFSDVFWDTNRTWADIFSGSGTYALASLLPVFDGTDGTNTVSANGVVAGEGRFYYTGSNLNWSTFSAVPEPTSALVGMLLGAGLLRRRRTDEHG